jgi:hypothetical protein
MIQLKIDHEFKSLIPPLTDEEYQQLTDLLLKEGCRDALITWNGTIIDGHNRYEICKYHNINFRTEEKQFGNRDEAKEWIIRNQFGRRNLSDYNRSVLALELKSLISAKAKERQLSGLKNQNVVPQHVAERGETNEELAKIAGVSHETIRRVELIQKEAPKEVKEKVAKGEMSIRQGYYSVRPKKEDKPVKQPDKPKNEETEVKKELSGEESPSNHPLISIAQIEALVRDFLGEAMPYALMFDKIQLLSEFEKQAIAKEIRAVEEWAAIFRNALNNIPTNYEERAK